METAASPGSRLQIRRFQLRCLLPAEHPAPERVRARLEEAAARDLSQTLSAALSAWFDGAGDGLWLIRRLDVALDVDAAADREALARRWAAQIARSLGATLQAGEDDENALWFPDRAAYLARFLADTAAGRAGDRWYYESFAGMRLLPTSAILRTAIRDLPSLGLAALLRLSPEDRARVLGALGAGDARRVLDTLAEAAPPGDPARCLEAAWHVLHASDDDGSPGAGEEAREALRLYLGALQEGGGGPPLRAAAMALLRLARWLRFGALSAGNALLAALAGGEMAALYVAAGAADAETLLPLLAAPAAWLREVGEALLARRVGGPALEPATGTPPERRHTPFGGLFLLLPVLDELPLDAATRRWPDAPDGTSAAAVTRFLILVKCLGRPRAFRAFYDPLLRDLAGVPPSLSFAELAEWQAGLSPALRARFLDELARWQQERGPLVIADRPPTWILARVRAPGAPVGILLDAARLLWRFAAGYPPRRPERLIEALRQFVPPDETLLCDPVFLPALPGAIGLGDPAVQARAEEDAALAEALARLPRLAEDLAYLSLPPAFGLTPPRDRTLGVAAQGLLRAFAWRLPGFARAHLPYLYANFLDLSASVEEEPERRVVRLTRPPLGLILGMTGMLRRVYRLSWLDARPLALFPEE